MLFNFLLAIAMLALAYMAYEYGIKKGYERGKKENAAATEAVLTKIVAPDNKYRTLQHNIDQYDGTGKGQVDLE